ncbi:hypothetical protein ABT034_22745 [Streptomyces sp. NPDC002773]|uniref:hypothetical protein n=1 Tax=Streptomyces sp. NPDC002773 TaxID=3154430 RepID=UPI00332EEFA0
MHGTRTTAKILVGAAVAALAGCVSVDAPPTAPAPAPAAAETVRSGQDVAPQMIEGPAREALEAALPAPPPPAAPRTAPTSDVHERAAPAPRAEAQPPEAVPRQREREHPRPTARPTLPELPEVPGVPDLTGLPRERPASRADVCELGERYGGWAPGSDQSRICHGTYGR